MGSDVTRVWVLGGLTPDFHFDATVRESHTSQLTVTDNPVETGVVVSDHAFMQPLRLEIEAAVSDTPLSTPEDDSFASEVSRSAKAFQLLQQLQSAAEPFNVQTGLRFYENLIIETLTAEQDKDTANVLAFRASLREVIIVSTQTVTYPPRAAGKPTRQASQKVSGGEKKAQAPANDSQRESILHSLIASQKVDIGSALKSALGFDNPNAGGP
jgi:hypothetical protein